MFVIACSITGNAPLSESGLSRFKSLQANRRVTQWLEYQLDKLEVVGSNPTMPTMGIVIDEMGLTIINGKYGPLKPKTTSFYARGSCMCCTPRMQFKDEESIKRKFREVGLSVCAEIIDDTGERFEIDTFFGWWKESEKPHELDYLIEEVVK